MALDEEDDKKLARVCRNLDKFDGCMIAARARVTRYLMEGTDAVIVITIPIRHGGMSCPTCAETVHLRGEKW